MIARFAKKFTNFPFAPELRETNQMALLLFYYSRQIKFEPYFGVSPRRRTRVCVAAISNRLDYSLSRVIEERHDT